MRIIRFQGENFKRMKAFDITPKGNTVVLSGKNGAGKSSVLDGITMLFAGKTSEIAKLTTKPIHAGEKKARVSADVGDWTITRTWTEKDTYLEIASKDGAVFKSPQAMLDSVIGILNFDPMQFSRMSPREQKEALLGIVQLPIDLAKWQKDYDAKYQIRTDFGKEMKKLKAYVESMPDPPAGTPDVAVSMTQASIDYQAAVQKNDKIEALTKSADQKRREVVELEERAKVLRAEVTGIEGELKDLGPLVNVAEAQIKLTTAEETNKHVQMKNDKKAKVLELAKVERDHAAVDADLGAMKLARDEAIAAASFPVPGLSFSDEGVTFKQTVKHAGDIESVDQIPYGQLSTALQTKIAMAIAMAANPKLKVIRISDGSLLDDDTMKAIEEMAEKNDYQIWIEKVDSSGKIGVVIEDGEVVADNSEAPTDGK